MLDNQKKVNLRTVADRVGLAPCSVSAVLNDTPAAKAIPQSTKDRVFRAAAELHYRPNLWARSLRTRRTKMVAVATPDFGRGRVAQVIAGLQARLHTKGYLLALASIDFGDGNPLEVQFQQRGIEGVIAIDIALPPELDLAVASVDLGYTAAHDPVTKDMHLWLARLGETAADTIIRQIENREASGNLQVEPKLPPAYFEVPSLQTTADVRESA